jgi:hypothetical protein
MFLATVYDPQGRVVVRDENGEPLTFERDNERRAWLSARNYDYPPGVRIVCTHQPKRVPGTSLQRPPVTVWDRTWTGEVWVETGTSEIVP